MYSENLNQLAINYVIKDYEFYVRRHDYTKAGIMDYILKILHKEIAIPKLKDCSIEGKCYNCGTLEQKGNYCSNCGQRIM